DAAGLIPPERRPTFAIAGHGTDEEKLQAAVRDADLEGDVRLLGRCSDAELESLYALACCFVLPTLHEGFGLPVIEAMARSVPVLCSDIPVLREVGGSAAVYFDPRSPAAIAAGVREVLETPALAQRLREAGPKRAAGFSWGAAADATLASYRRALRG
ncbi:MAG: glycosyltransferase family 4 protein, partial [Solirubrobacteraceae bacterium]